MKKPKLVRCENCDRLKRDNKRLLEAIDNLNGDVRALWEKVKKLEAENREHEKAKRTLRGVTYERIRSNVKNYEQSLDYTGQKKSDFSLIHDNYTYRKLVRYYEGVLGAVRHILTIDVFGAFFRQFFAPISKKLTFFNHHVSCSETQVSREIFNVLGRGHGVYRSKHTAAL